MDRILLDTPSKLKPGDLVRGDPSFWTGTPVFGVIIMPSTRTNIWADTAHYWWVILLSGGDLIEDTEGVWDKLNE